MYKLEKNQSRMVDSNEWQQCKSWNELPIEFEDLSSAISCFKRNYSDLARWIWPLRITDETGYIHHIYDPERDTRLPGCKWRRIQRDAYFLKEKAVNSESNEYYWLQAEANLEESDGVFGVEGEYVWYSHWDQ